MNRLRPAAVEWLLREKGEAVEVFPLLRDAKHNAEQAGTPSQEQRTAVGKGAIGQLKARAMIVSQDREMGQ